MRSSWLYLATRSLSAGGAGLDLAGVQRQRQVGNGGVLGLAGAVGRNGGVARLVRHLDGLERLRDRADLVQLDEDGVAAAQLMPLARRSVLVTNRSSPTSWTLPPSSFGHLLPAFPVLFIQAVLDGVDGVLLDQLLPVCDQFLAGKDLAALGQLYCSFLLPFHSLEAASMASTKSLPGT